MRTVRIYILLMALAMLVMLGLAARCFYLQYLQTDHFKSVAEASQAGFVPQKPQRGSILDRRGRILAASNLIRIIFADPQTIEYPKKVAARLQPVLDQPGHIICRRIIEAENPRYVPLKKNADAREYKQAVRLSGIGVQSDWRRHYPTGSLLCHVVGFTSADHRGLGGIELQYNDRLVGSGGRERFYADVFRRPVRKRASDTKHTDGKGMILTIDSAIQQFAREELRKQFEEYRAASAVSIVAEPATGEILAMVSLPDFDPEKITSKDSEAMRNRALADPFEPGSLLKPIAAAIAIDEGAVTLDEKIYCEKGFYSGRGFGRISEYGHHAFGDISVAEILIESSNIGMAKIGQKLGKEKLYDGLRRFGFGKKTGIDLPGEGTGLLRTPDKWTGYSVTRIPFGQEISATAVQLVQAFCILANGGKYIQPHVVKAVVDNSGEPSVINRNAPPVGYVIDPDVAGDVVTKALAEVVNRGTGTRAKLEKWQLFGKTGTAEIAKSTEQGYDDSAYVASFLAGAPAENPRLIVLVSIYKPDISLDKGHTGGTVAAPVVKRIMKRSLEYLENSTN